MTNDLSQVLQPHDGDLDNYQAPEVVNCVEDLEDAVSFLAELDHSENSPWAYLGDNAVVVLNKLTIVRNYLLNPGDQQRMGAHSLDEIFLHSFSEGLMIGGKKITSATKLDLAISDLADMLGYRMPRVEIPLHIANVINRVAKDNPVIDHDDVF